MPCIERQALVPYSPQAMFDLVSAVDRYPQFLPWCASSRILVQRDDGIDASLQVRFKGIQQQFSTRNLHQAPGLIRMQLLDGPFERLEGSWHFDPLGDAGPKHHDTQPEAYGTEPEAYGTQPEAYDSDKGLRGTKVRLRLDYQMKSGLLAKLFSPAFDSIAACMIWRGKRHCLSIC
ncbi:MAG: type II toxin-antitoxin system RatA family toxin [Betaproteobacteria bacterium]|nr:type II toxin-antitoxin system RatA family toxin [Betaproteobacteria bacterium]